MWYWIRLLLGKTGSGALRSHESQGEEAGQYGQSPPPSGHLPPPPAARKVEAPAARKVEEGSWKVVEGAWKVWWRVPTD